jgi:NADH-quinone oxidoreductase subunit L
MNKIGDVFFLLGMMLCFDIFKSLDFSVIFALAGSFKNVDTVFFGQHVNGLEFLCFFFLIAAMAKSAQIGLHT